MVAASIVFYTLLALWGVCAIVIAIYYHTDTGEKIAAYANKHWWAMALLCIPIWFGAMLGSFIKDIIIPLVKKKQYFSAACFILLAILIMAIIWLLPPQED